jgi:hypothetical protein
MNWLNSIDNILDRAFVAGQEADEGDSFTNGSSVSTGTSHLEESGTWSEDDDESNHVHLAFSLAEDVIDEGDEKEFAEEDAEDDQNADAKTPPAPPMLQTRIAPSANFVRPGNIRLRAMKPVSSSSEEESDSVQEPVLDEKRRDILSPKEEVKKPVHESAESPQKKLKPIALTDQDFSLE